MINILIADTSPIVRMGLATILQEIFAAGLHIIFVGSGDDFSINLRKEQLSLVFVNPSFVGRQSVKKLKEEWGSPAVLAIVYQVHEPYLLYGYDTFLSIYDGKEEIRNKVKKYCKKVIFEKENLPEQVQDNRQPLTQREEEVIACIAKGMTTRQIAQELFLSELTIYTHRRNIADKLKIHSISGLTAYAIMNRLVDIGEIKG
ncbi:MAG: response regulator transcription factor [Tannerellaceae bacterium]|jgi:DNA-binding NarL/FixJ family response regulator|nr:response regulator transcription factor [Tannerellaceae bacterium]